MDKLQLHGFFLSPFTFRLIWILKLKGIQYEYIEEHLPDKKSQLLLQYNPIYKKVPVLVHGGKPLAESPIIVEYIEETWPEPSLLPRDVYERALARFWIKFGDNLGPLVHAFFQTSGEEQENATKQLVELLKVLEDQGLGQKKFFGGDGINLVDISYGWLSYWFQVMEEAVGIKVMKPSTLPHLCSWAENFKAAPVVKENLPDRTMLRNYVIQARKKFVPESPDTSNHTNLQV